MQPGDILSHTDSVGIVRRWLVQSVYLGGEFQESVVEIKSLSHMVPSNGGGDVTMCVPEILLRELDNQSKRAREAGGVDLSGAPHGRA